MKEPRWTCPLTDDTVGAAKDLIGDLDSAEDLCENEDGKNIIRSAMHQLNNMIGLMEEMRSANSELREWGQYHKDEYDRISDELWDMEQKYDDKCDELIRLRAGEIS